MSCTPFAGQNTQQFSIALLFAKFFTLFTFAQNVTWTKAVQFYDHLQNGFFTLKSLKQNCDSKAIIQKLKTFENDRLEKREQNDLHILEVMMQEAPDKKLLFNLPPLPQRAIYFQVVHQLRANDCQNCRLWANYVANIIHVSYP